MPFAAAAVGDGCAAREIFAAEVRSWLLARRHRFIAAKLLPVIDATCARYMLILPSMAVKYMYKMIKT